MSTLLDLRQTKARFARSANVERDTDGLAVASFLPTSRALDVLRRISVALDRDDVEVAISITGPYGSGKSSLALLIDALLGPQEDEARHVAEEIIDAVAPETLALLGHALDRLGARKSGFIRATVTAQREAIGLTLIRGLQRGVERFQPAKADAKQFAAAKARIEALYVDVVDNGRPIPSPREFRSILSELGGVAPILLLVDEFGKNLEAFADSASDADLFLLQELAEWSRGGDDVPLALITMQHMAFDEYAATTSSTLRREWAKVQGRFEDIPYIDSPQHTRALIAAVFEPGAKTSAEVIEQWAVSEAAQASSLGLTDLGASSSAISACWPLHPLALQALPELCERYGQNERTLFSFLAGHEPGSVATFLSETSWAKGENLPVVRLDRLYDYFLEAAGNLVNVSAGANRWMEIDARIRDASAVSAAARRILKAVGILNLVSAGGVLRASPGLLGWACADGEEGSESAADVLARISELETAGLLTYRDFADEYRVWQGTDFDIKSSVESARARLRGESLQGILESTLPLEPVVASRHSHQTGTLRAFKRVWGGSCNDPIYPLTSRDRFDGLAIFCLDSKPPIDDVVEVEHQRPVIFVMTDDASELETAAIEVAAIDYVLHEGGVEDWVARRELEERRFQGLQHLQRAFHQAFASGDLKTEAWDPDGGWSEKSGADISSVVSEVADEWYGQAPVIRNDIVNRHELSSQAAKARRLLLESMVASNSEEGFGIEGFGPDKTLYLSAVKELGLHREVSGEWRLTEPKKAGDSLLPAWKELDRLLERSSGESIRVGEIIDGLAAPPWGVREGIAPVFIVAALLLQEDNVALYEHGTFRPRMADDVLERLLKNPNNFTVRQFGARRGLRASYLQGIADGLGIPVSRRSGPGPKAASVLAVVSHLVLMANTLPEYAKKATQLDPDVVKVRRALFAATAPDALLFAEIPEALGYSIVPASGSGRLPSGLVERFVNAVGALKAAYPRLLDKIEMALVTNFDVGQKRKAQEQLSAQACEIEGVVSEQGLKRVVTALKADVGDRDGWLAYVGMNIVGKPPESWTVDDAKLFDARAKELGGAFRRVVALHGSLEGGGDDVVRVLVTKPDGTEAAAMIRGSGLKRSNHQAAVRKAVASFKEQMNYKSTQEAREVLLGTLLEDI